MKTISVGELRQNPSDMVADVEAGEVYELTMHNQRVGFIVPALSSATLVPPRSPARSARTRDIARHELRTATTVDELLESEKGDW
jgi:antitoxin (DNA-binding transcriptional repressor) of toxin-antitoxin stability system